jgi:hypothetical protein
MSGWADSYIGRILDAFKEDELKAVPDAADQISSSPHNRFSLSSSNSAFRIPNSTFLYIHHFGAVAVPKMILDSMHYY